jgi:hypothetical protein
MMTTEDSLAHALTFLPGTEPIAPTPVVHDPLPDRVRDRRRAARDAVAGVSRRLQWRRARAPW